MAHNNANTATTINNNLYVISDDTLKRSIFDAVKEATAAKSGTVLPIEFFKTAFGRNLSEANYPKVMYAIAELIDNAIAASRGRGISKRIDVNIEKESDGSVSVTVLNAGKPFPDDAVTKYGNGGKEECENSFGTGLKHATAVLGGKSAYVATKRKNGIFGFDLTDWTKGSVKHKLDKNDWNYDNKLVTTAIKMTTDDNDIAESLLKVDANMIGAFYWPLLYAGRQSVNLYFNGTHVTPWIIDGDLVTVRTASLSINETVIEVDIFEYKMHNSAKDALYFGKNLRWQGISMYANGRAIEHSAVSSIVRGKRKGIITNHPVFNERITIINVHFDKDNRDADLPFASNNKASIAWGSTIGEQYRTQLDALVGDAYRQLHYNERERRDRADVDYYLLHSLSNSGITYYDMAAEKELALPGYDFKLDLAIGDAVLDKNGNPVTKEMRLLEMIDDNLKEVTRTNKELDFNKIGIVFEFSGRYRELSSAKIYTLMEKVKAVEAITGTCPDGILFCRGLKSNKTINAARNIYRTVTGKDIIVLPFRYELGDVVE